MFSFKSPNVINKNIEPQEAYKLYGSILKQIFENINYYISKKNPNYKYVYEKTKYYLEKLPNDFDLNADKYFPVLAKSIEVENYKLGKYLFPDLKLLIKNNFLLGETPLNYLEFDIESLNDNSNNKKKKMIDLIVDSLTSADSIFTDDDIWYMLVECIIEIINNKNMINNLCGETFQKIYSFLFRMNMKLNGKKDKVNLIKENLYFFIKNSFIELNLFINFSSPISPNDESNQETINSTEYNDKNSTENKNDLMEIYENLRSYNYIKNYEFNAINPIDLLVCRTMKTIVDNICYREANKQLTKYISPLIPRTNSDFFKPIYRSIKFPQIKNENNFMSGFFGWCNICRKTANYYSIDYRIPICSYYCKNYLLSEEIQLNNLKNNFVKDCPLIIKYFSQVLSNKIKISTDKYEIVNQKIFSLEIISYIFDNYSKYICTQIRFIKVVKENLMEGLFKTCLSNEFEIYSRSVKLFFEIFKYFKEYLKPQINYFIENVFLKILNSNSLFLLKKVILNIQ